MKTENEWISTKDRLPDENVSVLVFIPETMSETISRLQRKVYQLEHKILDLQNL